MYVGQPYILVTLSKPYLHDYATYLSMSQICFCKDQDLNLTLVLLRWVHHVNLCCFREHALSTPLILLHSVDCGSN